MEPTDEFDSKQLRQALGRFATGVTVITARDGSGAPVGLAANSFTSVSLDPPLLLFCLARSAGSFDAFTPDAPFAVNVLSGDQEDVSNRFATRAEDKFAEFETDTWQTGVPILRGCLANLECQTEQRVDAGDHVVIIGRVLRLQGVDLGEPLLFYAGRYARLG